MDTTRGDRRWHKAIKSGANGGNCVDVSWTLANGAPAAEVLVEDTKDRAAGTLSFGRSTWAGFLAGVRAGEFGPQ